MNASQKDMLRFYGNDTICLDFMHKMDAYGFDLATFLVLDKREGFPAAFILSNRQDFTTLTLAFPAIKEHTCISPRVLLITKKEIQVEAYKIVRSLLVETDEAAFDRMSKEALKMLDEKDDMKEFKRYFEQTYSKRSEIRAYCHRKWYRINFNMHIESMHRTIKKGKVSSKIAELRKRRKVGQSLTSLCIRNNEKNGHLAPQKQKFETNSTVQGERQSLDLHITDEEMIICEDRKVLEKEAHVDNLRIASTWTEISKEEFQKKCMQIINKAYPEQYNILTFLRNIGDSLHLFPEANREIVSRTLNMEPPNKKIRYRDMFQQKRRLLRKFQLH
ncbi:MULE domain-containing protein [Trichonephila inaurata madagascariensis]|uniref:MULE domain-containing protein n=1 Tax=Trichonephila inaurata madagascariensis TaxID=2747483 RepID=A0A8X6Y5K4_9ARAC|nr:MULE domain-containing protein [Trichonephila inaurata madagascariensis]